MAWYRVVAVNEDVRPLAGVDVEAVNLTDRSTSAVVTTNRSGEALFTDLTGPHFFRPRVRRTSTSVGDRSYTGEVKIQIVGFSGNLCIDFVVDVDGGGTHTTLASAVAAAIAQLGNGETAHIWLCSNVTEGTIDIGGLNASANIIITGPDRDRVRITAPLNQDIFVQNSNGGNTNGRLGFSNIGIDPDEANSRAILDINTVSEVRNVTFENVLFIGNGGYILRQDGLDSLGNIQLEVTNCRGTLDGFYLVAGLSGTFAPDSITAIGNQLTLTRWWHQTGGVDADPNSLSLQGGVYSIGTGLTFANGDQFYWQSFVLLFTGTGAAFTTPAASQNIRSLMFSDISFRVFDDSGYFGEFGSAAVNKNSGLFLKNIFGHAISGVTVTATNFINVDTDYLNVHAGNLLAVGGWTNTYTGPNGGYTGDHGVLGGLVDDDHTQYLLLAGRGVEQDITGGLTISTYLRVGSAATPINVTAGDVTLSRLFVGNFALGSGFRLVQIQDDYTPGAGQFHTVGSLVNATPGAGLATDEIRASKFEVNVRPTANYAGGAFGFYTEADHDSGAFDVNLLTGFFGQVFQRVAATTVSAARAGWLQYRISAGTYGEVTGLHIERGVAGDVGTITTGTGLLITASAGVTPTNDIAIRTLGGHHRFVDGINIGTDATPDASRLLSVRGDANVDGVLYVGNTALTSDNQFFLSGADTVTPRITFDADDVMQYVRSSDVWQFIISGNEIFRISIAGSPSGWFTQPTISSEVLRLRSTATNDDPTESVFQNRAATTDATVTTLHTIAIPASTTVQIIAYVQARRTGGTAGTAEDAAGFVIVATVKNVAGTATQVGTSPILSVTHNEALNPFTATIDVSGANARVRVTGALDNNITWHTTIRVLQVGS